MTDNEIIKAFKVCEVETYPHCNECPLKGNPTNCRDVLHERIFQIINRQKAEIERLKEFIVKTRQSDKELKAEAVKEFAERLNKEAEKVGIDQEGDFVEADNKIYDTVADWCKATSKNILKEMEGDSE